LISFLSSVSSAVVVSVLVVLARLVLASKPSTQLPPLIVVVALEIQ
jgi:hypothetical protein